MEKVSRFTAVMSVINGTLLFLLFILIRIHLVNINENITSLIKTSKVVAVQPIEPNKDSLILNLESFNSLLQKEIILLDRTNAALNEQLMYR